MATRAVVLCVVALAVLVTSQSSSSSTAAGSTSSSVSDTAAASSTVVSGVSSTVGVSSTAAVASSSTGVAGSISASGAGNSSTALGSSSTGATGSGSNSTNGTVMHTASSSGAVSSTAWALVIDFNVSVSNYSGRNHYFIQGMTGPEPELYLTIGRTYAFEINAPSDPFWIKTAPVSGNASAYWTGLSANGVNSSIFTFAVTASTPRQLYYVSQFNSWMAGNISVVEASSSTFVPYLLSSTGPVNANITSGPVKENDDKLKLGLGLGIGLGGGVLLILIIVCCCCCKKRSGTRGSGLQEQEIVPTANH